jgi:hypothetical protein
MASLALRRMRPRRSPLIEWQILEDEREWSAATVRRVPTACAEPAPRRAWPWLAAGGAQAGAPV